MKKPSLFVVLAALFLSLALDSSEPWDKKPYEQWSEKDIERVLKNSPWAKQVSVAVSVPAATGGEMGGGGRRRGGGGATMDTGEGMGGGGGMAAGGMADRGAGGGAPAGAMPPASVTAIIRWQSARPVKQALAKAKYGSEVETVAQIKELVNREETRYVIALAELPPRLSRMDPARVQAALQGVTALTVKGQEPRRPEAVQLQPGEKSASIFFAFSRTKPITLEDKEVEFSTHIGSLEFKKKFKLQEMVFAGKLDL